MEQFPYENLEQLAQYIEATVSKDPETQKKALDYLEEMGKDPVRFSKAMLSYMILPIPRTGILLKFLQVHYFLEETSKLKRSASILLTSILGYQDEISLEQKNQVILHVYEAIFSDQLDFLLKPTLQPLLVLFFKGDEGKRK